MDGKKADDNLDASFIISQASKRDRKAVRDEPAAAEMAADTPDEAVPQVPREDSRRRKTKGQDYESLFIRNVYASTRSGKTVYIRKEFHDRITRIVQVIGGNEVSLYSYLNNVLEHHFNTWQEDVEKLYKERNTNIF
jgi:hypothetical protein